jgi:putative hydrolase of the HAD superfamily
MKFMKKSLFFFFIATASLFAAPKAVVFDFGGVMVGKPDHESAARFLRKSLRLSEADFKTTDGARKKAAKAGITDEEFWTSFAKRKGINIPSEWGQQFKSMNQYAYGMNPEMYTLIDELKAKGVRVALLSNVHPGRSKRLRALGLYEPFDPCLLSCEIRVKKPSSRAYKILLRSLGLRSSKVVFIDDKKRNIRAAKKLGIDAIQFLSPRQIRKQLKKRSLL